MLLMESERVRMIFDTDEVVRRAVKIRAAAKGIKTSDVINLALKAFLPSELKQACKEVQDEPKPKKD